MGVDRGLREFMEEFMAHLVISDKSGREATMGEMLLPQYKTSLENGSQKEIKLLG